MFNSILISEMQEKKRKDGERYNKMKDQENKKKDKDNGIFFVFFLNFCL